MPALRPKPHRRKQQRKAHSRKCAINSSQKWLVPKCVTLFATCRPSKPKTDLATPREAPQLGSKGFSFSKEASGQHNISDSDAPPRAEGERQARAEGEAANSLLNFFRQRPGAAPPPLAAPPQLTERVDDGRQHTSHQPHINTERPAYDSETPIIEQMLPEIARANESAKNTSMRDALAIARGYVTGVRANGTTTGATLWAELLQRDGQCRHTLSRAWGLIHTTESTKETFFGIYKEQPLARAATIIDTAAKKYGVAPTTLNRLLVWAWAAAGPTEPTQEP